MYSISNDYRTKMLDQVQTHRLTGLLAGTISFTDADVIGVSYHNQCSGKNVALGSVNIGTLKLTFLNDPLNRGDYYRKTISISDGLLVDNSDPDNPVFEDIPIGVFYIAEATWRASGMVDITAYDVLSLLDKDINIDESYGSVYSWCKYIEQETGAVFGMTSEECAALPNGSELLAPYEDADIKTFRDLLSALTQIIGGFAYASRDGKWKIRAFDNSSVLTIPKNRRYTGAKYSDFTTYYDTVSYVEASTNTVITIGDGEGLLMKLGMNAFLQYGSAVATNRKVRVILDTVKQMTYTPFEVAIMPALCALDLGDVISFTDDYTENTSSGAVMDVTWTYNKSFKVKSFGDNPNLRSAQSMTDKNISGLINNTAKNEVVYYNFSNIEEITFGPEEETTIASLYFIPTQETTVKILHEFIMDIVSDLAVGGSYELHYYLDGELLSYKPTESLGAITAFQSGTDTPATITRDFFYILKDMEPNIRHSWEVKILAHGISSMTIDVNHAHVTLEGQRLYSEEYWGGYIEAQDVITLIPIGKLEMVEITDEAEVNLYNAMFIQATDNFNLCSISELRLIPFTEGTGEHSPHIFFEGGFKIITEAGDYITTEDAHRLITE